MQNRSFSLLQAVMAFCVWALVALICWPWIVDVRTDFLSQGVANVETSRLIGAALIVFLEIGLLAFVIHRLARFASASKGEAAP